MSESKQIRELYRNSNKTLARITINKLDGHEETYLDFKDDNNSNDVLKVSRETVPLKIEKYTPIAKDEKIKYMAMGFNGMDNSENVDNHFSKYYSKYFILD